MQRVPEAASLDGRQKESISLKQTLNINERRWSGVHTEL